MTARRRRALGLGALVLALGGIVPGGPALGQEGGEVGYDFYVVDAQGDGVTVDFNLVGFLPIEDLVGLSSITSEAHFGVGRSDALAALPDPGDLILTLPGTLSALLGVSGLPDYAAAAFANDPSRPVDDVQLLPDAGLGAAKLHTEAAPGGAAAEAFVGHQVDTVGLIPGFSIGTVRTTASAQRLATGVLEATATTSVSDVRLLGGLLRISEITSEVTVGIINDKPTAKVGKVDVAGVTVAGQAVGITKDGIVAPGQSLAIAPVLDSLLAPLVGEGIVVRTLPATQQMGDRTASANGGALAIDVPIDVQGYPGILRVTLGQAKASLEVGPLAGAEDDGGDATGGDGSSVDLGGTPLPGLGSSADFGGGLPTTPPADGGTGRGTVTEIVSVPVGRQIEDWDVTTMYRTLLLGGVALFAAGRVVVRTSLRPVRRANDLRTLWRW